VLRPPLGRLLARRPRRRRVRGGWPLSARPGLRQHAGVRAERRFDRVPLTLRLATRPREPRTIVRVEHTVLREGPHTGGARPSGARGAPGPAGRTGRPGAAPLAVVPRALRLVVRERALWMVREHLRREREVRLEHRFHAAAPPRPPAPAARGSALAPAAAPPLPAPAPPAAAAPPAPLKPAAAGSAPAQRPAERAGIVLDDLVEQVLRRIERRAIAQRERLGTG
jgi:hypothetical protein